MSRMLLCFLLLVPCRAVRADWFRDFNDGTLQGLIVLDPLGGTFTATGVGGSLRLQSTGTGGNEDTVILYDPASFTDVSALLLIRYSTNPNLGPPGTKMNGGLLLRGNPATLSGYVLVMNDSGYLQMRKAAYGAVSDICATGFLQDVPGFTHTQDWWMRFEVFDQNGVVHLRGRVWPDGMPETCEWQVECQDARNPYLSGVAALIGDEDENGFFLDLDNASARAELTCVEICDNGIDDDGNLLIDCYDPHCSGHPQCQCPAPWADADGDKDVDMDDFGAFQVCYTGPAGPGLDITSCQCFDRDRNMTVDSDDLLKFDDCASGPSIPANPACGQ